MRPRVAQQKPTSSSISPLVPLVLMSFRRPGVRRRADLHGAGMALRAASVNAASVNGRTHRVIPPGGLAARIFARNEYGTPFPAINSGGAECKGVRRPAAGLGVRPQPGQAPPNGRSRDDRGTDPMTVKMPAPDQTVLDRR